MTAVLDILGAAISGAPPARAGGVRAGGASGTRMIDLWVITTKATSDQPVCPACGYSLRGLPRGVIPCPECGARCNADATAIQQWRGPWYRVPGLFALLLPGAWAVLAGGMALATVLATGLTGPAPLLPLTASALTAALVVWIWLMARARSQFRGRGAIRLAVLGHGVVLGVALSAPVALLSPLAAAGSLWFGQAAAAGFCLLCTAYAAMFFLIPWSGLLLIAEECAKRHLQRNVDTPAGRSSAFPVPAPRLSAAPVPRQQDRRRV